MKQIYITATVVIGSLLLWLGAMGIGQYLSDEPARKMKPHEHHAVEMKNKQHATGSLLSPEARAELEAAYEKDPSSLTASVNFANFLFEEGMSEANPESLKRAVGIFHQVLEMDNKQPDALLGLGTLSLHVGVAEKAIEYYKQYVEVKPEDLSIASNLALAEARSGMPEEALKRLDAILKTNPDFVIALVTKGLILSEQGETGHARDLWLRAESLESNETLKQRISSLVVDSLRRDSVGNTAKENNSDEKSAKTPIKTYANSTNNDAKSTALLSSEASASKLKAYFKSHQIIGPKLYDAFKESDTKFLVLLQDFPVDAMPPVAKEVFTGRVKEQLQGLSFDEVVLMDAKTRQVLMTVTK